MIIQLPPPAPLPSVPTSSPTAAPSNGGGNPQPPSPTNPPAGGNGGCQGWPNNCNPVASIHAYVYYLQCDGAVVDAKYATDGPWDCDVVLDATPKDAAGKHTQASGGPELDVSSGWSLVIRGNPYTPRILGGRTGEVTFSVRIDGVTSNVTTYLFR